MAGQKLGCRKHNGVTFPRRPGRRREALSLPTFRFQSDHAIEINSIRAPVKERPAKGCFPGVYLLWNGLSRRAGEHAGMNALPLGQADALVDDVQCDRGLVLVEDKRGREAERALAAAQDQ